MFLIKVEFLRLVGLLLFINFNDILKFLELSDFSQTTFIEMLLFKCLDQEPPKSTKFDAPRIFIWTTFTDRRRNLGKIAQQP